MTKPIQDIDVMGQKEVPSVPLPNTPPVVATPAYLLQMAVESGKDLDYVEKLMGMQERWEDKQAEKAFNVAMAEFSSNLPIIEKTVYVEHFDGYHADLGVMAKLIREAMAPHGLSFAWKTKQEDQITVACVIKHRDGHSESVTLSSAPDTSGGKNSIQAIGSAVKYLERYTLESATGIVASGGGDDGQTAAGPDFITDEQALSLEAFVTDNGLNMDSILAYVESKTGTAAFYSIKAPDYDAFMGILKKKVGQRQPGEDG
jgi:hypothetical protein